MTDPSPDKHSRFNRPDRVDKPVPPVDGGSQEWQNLLSPVAPAAPMQRALSQEQEFARNRTFIDQKHLEAARLFVRESGFAADPTQVDRYIHLYYLPGCGRLPGNAWQCFNRGVDYATVRASRGLLLVVPRILKLNAIFNHGVAPDNLGEVIRSSRHVMGVTRVTEDFCRVFDQHGRYITGGVPPPVAGFVGEQQFRVQDRTLKVSAADLLRELKFAQPTSERITEIGQMLSRVLHATPHEVAEKNCVLVFSISQRELYDHLRGVEHHYLTQADIISFNRDHTHDPGSRAYQEAVMRLAVQTGRTVDIGHFSLDAMGRTNLQIEHYIQRQFGLEPPIPFGCWIGDRGFENGAYFEEELRIEALLNAAARPEPVRCAEAVSRVRAELAKRNRGI